MYAVLMGSLFAFLAALYMWRNMILNLVKQNADTE
jgi:hypothetical protein